MPRSGGVSQQTENSGAGPHSPDTDTIEGTTSTCKTISSRLSLLATRTPAGNRSSHEAHTGSTSLRLQLPTQEVTRNQGLPVTRLNCAICSKAPPTSQPQYNTGLSIPVCTTTLTIIQVNKLATSKSLNPWAVQLVLISNISSAHTLRRSSNALSAPPPPTRNLLANPHLHCSIH